MTRFSPPAPGCVQFLGRLCDGDEGVAAVEFAILAPVLASSLLLMADIGLAVSQKMEMDSAVRTAAQLSMADPGIVSTQAALDTLTDGKAFAATASLYCACLSGSNCTEPCTSGSDHVSYMLVASGQYESMITPFAINLKSQIEVRVK